MTTKLIALAAAFGIVFALASPGFADERRAGTAYSGAGKLKSGKVKRSTQENTSASRAPEVQGGKIDVSGKPDLTKGNIVYF